MDSISIIIQWQPLCRLHSVLNLTLTSSPCTVEAAPTPADDVPDGAKNSSSKVMKLIAKRRKDSNNLTPA